MNLENETIPLPCKENIVSESENLQPLLFFGHGNPLNALDTNKYTESWSKMAEDIKPRAILVISAHWETSGSHIYSGHNNKMIYDFFGFPQKLFEVKYPAPSFNSLAECIHLTHPEIDLNTTWGLDHGAWSVLVKAFPQANIPVIQLSINKNLTLQEHWDLACQLKYLRKLGILIIGSGNIVHNLRAMNKDNNVSPWNLNIHNKILEIIKSKQYSSLIDLEKEPDFKLAHPTKEHFIPLIYIFALAEEQDDVSIITPEFELGSISMTSFKLK